MASEGSSLASAGRSDLSAPPRRSLVSVIGDGLAAWLPALPLILLAFFFLVLPTIELIVRSFYTPELGWTLSFWEDTLTSNGSRKAITTSIRLGLASALIALIVGGPLSWLISRMVTSKRSTWLALLNVGANFGGIGLAFGYMAALGTYGMVTLGIQKLISGFVPPAVGSFTSLVMAYSYTNVPLFVLLTLPAMSILRNDWMEAAETCSASRWQFWRYIGLPVLAPFLASGAILIFTWSIGLYGLAYALGRTASTTGELRLITLQIGLTLNTGAGKEERAYVLAVVLLLLATVSLLAYRLMLKRALRWFS